MFYSIKAKKKSEFETKIRRYFIPIPNYKWMKYKINSLITPFDFKISKLYRIFSFFQK